MALSRFSINCSKLSKAMSLSSMVISGSEDSIACIEAIIKSASLGPPKRAAIASGLSVDCGVVVWVADVGSSLLVAEFETDHLRSSFSLGSMLGVIT